MMKYNDFVKLNFEQFKNSFPKLEDDDFVNMILFESCKNSESNYDTFLLGYNEEPETVSLTYNNNQEEIEVIERSLSKELAYFDFSEISTNWAIKNKFTYLPRNLEFSFIVNNFTFKYLRFSDNISELKDYYGENFEIDLTSNFHNYLDAYFFQILIADWDLDFTIGSCTILGICTTNKYTDLFLISVTDNKNIFKGIYCKSIGVSETEIIKVGNHLSEFFALDELDPNNNFKIIAPKTTSINDLLDKIIYLQSDGDIVRDITELDYIHLFNSIKSQFFTSEQLDITFKFESKTDDLFKFCIEFNEHSSEILIEQNIIYILEMESLLKQINSFLEKIGITKNLYAFEFKERDYQFKVIFGDLSLYSKILNCHDINIFSTLK